MSKVTSKLQVTLPKALAERYGIEPGDEIEWEAAGDAIRVRPAESRSGEEGIRERLRIFDQARVRQREREKRSGRRPKPSAGRGWRREDLYRRGRAR
jgi:AbrB family looped-hinge helix DNA binding protein